MRLLLIPVVVGVGCGDNNSAGPGPDGGDAADAGIDAPGDASDPESLAAMCGGAEPQTVAEWQACYLKRRCEASVNCTEWNLYADVAECIELRDAAEGGRLSFEAFERARSIAAGRASIDEEAFVQCLRELDARDCAVAGRPPTCGLRYAGTVDDGQPCLSDAECRSPGAHCEPQDCGDSCCLGTCEPRPGLGEECVDVYDCEPGMRCSIDSFTCVTADIGTTCAHRLDCDREAWCDTDEICQPDFAEGEPCNSLLQCGGETTCVGVMRGDDPRCRRITRPGDACDWFCFGNLYCDLSNPEGLGVCRPLPGEGEPCGFQRPCVGQNLLCGASGTCVRRADVGEPCSDGTCLPGLFCSDQLGDNNPDCRAPLADGASDCNQSAQCESYICDGDENAPGSCLPLQDSCQ